MPLLVKRNQHKFQVELLIEELELVTCPSGVLFSKVELVNGGDLYQVTSREWVKEQKVKWSTKHKFVCTMTLGESRAFEPCNLRVSVVQETTEAPLNHNLGFADLNLAQFAGFGLVQRRCVLDGYNPRYRLGNLTLKIVVNIRPLACDAYCVVASPQELIKKPRVFYIPVTKEWDSEPPKTKSSVNQCLDAEPAEPRRLRFSDDEPPVTEAPVLRSSNNELLATEAPVPRSSDDELLESHIPSVFPDPPLLGRSLCKDFNVSVERLISRFRRMPGS